MAHIKDYTPGTYVFEKGDDDRWYLGIVVKNSSYAPVTIYINLTPDGR